MMFCNKAWQVSAPQSWRGCRNVPEGEQGAVFYGGQETRVRFRQVGLMGAGWCFKAPTCRGEDEL